MFRLEKFVRTTQEFEYLFFLSRKAPNFFPEFNIRLYDKKSESDYFFFLHQNQNIFFSNIGNQNIFLEKIHNLCCQIRADVNSSTCTFTTEKSVTFTGACVNEIIPSINRSFVYKTKEGRYVRIFFYFDRTYEDYSRNLSYSLH